MNVSILTRFFIPESPLTTLRLCIRHCWQLL